jgi:hypothetical protein
MTELELALERLERAVARLEAAAGAERPDTDLPCAREADNPELRVLAGKIAERVDHALARIGRILGEGG